MDTPTIEELRIAASWCSNGEGTQLEQIALQRVSEWLDDLVDARELRDAMNHQLNCNSSMNHY